MPFDDDDFKRMKDLQDQFRTFDELVGRDALRALRVNRMFEDMAALQTQLSPIHEFVTRMNEPIEALVRPMKQFEERYGMPLRDLLRRVDEQFAPALRVYTDFADRFGRVLAPDLLAPFQKLAGSSSLVTLALQEMPDFSSHASLIFGADHRGLLAWRDEESAFELATVTHDDAPMASVPRRPPQTITIESHVRCARCGALLVTTASKATAITDSEIRTEFDVLPFCACVEDWDGTPEDLLRRPKPSLRVLQGGGERTAGGAPPSLRLVEKPKDAD